MNSLSKVKIDKEIFCSRSKKIFNKIQKPVLIMLGKKSSIKQFGMNSAIFNFLFGVEFTETIVIIKESKPFIYTSVKKEPTLSQLQSVADITYFNKSNNSTLCDCIGSLTEEYGVVDLNEDMGELFKFIIGKIRHEPIDHKILEIFRIKEVPEIENMKKAGLILNNILQKSIDLVRDEMFTRESMESLLYSKLSSGEYLTIDTSLAEFMYNPTFTTNSIKIGVRYNGYCAEIGRIFLEDNIEEYYNLQDFIVKCIKINKDSKDIMNEIEEHCLSQEIDKKVQIYTIGLLDKENDFSEGFILKKGMSFVIKIGSFFLNTYFLQSSSDLDSKVVFLTKKDNESSFSIESMRFRNKEKEFQLKNIVHDHQRELLDKLLDDMVKYHSVESNNIPLAKSSKISTFNISKYDSESLIPRSNNISLDHENNYILFPIGNYSVPFHIATVKNVAISHVPEGSKFKINFKDSKELKEAALSFGYATAQLVFNSAFRSISMITENSEKLLLEINEMKKYFNKPKISCKEQGKLILSQNKRIFLIDLLIKTDQKSGFKKYFGPLEIHENGFKYLEIHFLFSNIKKIFVQYGNVENDDMGLIHFYLKESILVNGKTTKNLQFHKKILFNIFDTSKRIDERLEYLRDQEEIERVKNDNKQFLNFVDHIEQSTKFKVQLLEKLFTASHYKEMVPIYVTSDCVVSVTEQPFMIILMEDVEICILERVGFNNKTFDCVFVHKNKNIPVLSIFSIDKSNLNLLKAKIDGFNKVFIETSINIKWKPLILTIMEDPISFYQDNGWSGLMGNGADDEDSDLAVSESSMSSIHSEETEESDIDSDSDINSDDSDTNSDSVSKSDEDDIESGDRTDSSISDETESEEDEKTFKRPKY